MHNVKNWAGFAFFILHLSSSVPFFVTPLDTSSPGKCNAELKGMEGAAVINNERSPHAEAGPDSHAREAAGPRRSRLRDDLLV